MLSEFLRLRKVGRAADGETAEFRCELPDANLERDDGWIDCGGVTARSDRGLLVSLAIDLNDAFISQLDDEIYDVGELLEAIVLSLGWEEQWIPDKRVEVELHDPRGIIKGEFLVESKILEPDALS